MLLVMTKGIVHDSTAVVNSTMMCQFFCGGASLYFI
jgi:hypothetical protein